MHRSFEGFCTGDHQQHHGKDVQQHAVQVIKLKEEKDRAAIRTEKRSERAEGRLTAPKQL